MNKKIIAALALGLVVLGYLALQPKRNTPVQQTVTPTESSGDGADRLEPLPETSEWAAEPSAEEPAASQEEDIAVKLVETLHADSSITDVAIIQSVECADNRCTVELEAKGEQDVQPTMLNFLQRHPEYGSNFKVAQSDNPRVTQFIFGKDKL